VLKDVVDLVLVPPAKVEEDDGEDSHDNIKDVDCVDHGNVFGSVLVVAGEETIEVPTALFRVLLAKVPTMATYDVVEIADQEAHEEVIDAHLYEDEVHRCTRI
jgi:hypothetical protein